MAGECDRRSENRCVTPFLLNPITWSTNLKPFVRLPKEKPTRIARAFQSMQMNLETKCGMSVSSYR